ncbi:MAG: hypothetical protein WBG18_12215 [Xanthobacteraceae bacterium]
MRTQQPGTFKKGHKKLGGRQKGTPNRFNRDLLQAIVQAADQVGSDGKGKGGVDGYLQMLAGKKEGYFVGLFRQAVQKQVTATEPENEVVYSTEQDFRQALLDRGVHPTLLPPPPRDFNERPPINGDLKPPKPPRGWQWVLCKKSESAELNEEQVDDPNAEDEASSKEVDPDDGPKGSAMNPVPGLEVGVRSEIWLILPSALLSRNEAGHRSRPLQTRNPTISPLL